MWLADGDGARYEVFVYLVPVDVGAVPVVVGHRTEEHRQALKLVFMRDEQYAVAGIEFLLRPGD